MLDLNPFTGLATLINSLIETRKVNQWIRLILSCVASGVVTWLFVFGSAGLAHLRTGARPSQAAILALFEACIATAGIIFFVWRRSPLTKDMPISAPADIESTERELLRKVIVTAKNEK